MAVINIFRFRLLEICDTDVFEVQSGLRYMPLKVFFLYICTTVFAEIINILYYNLLRNVHVMGNLIGGKIDLRKLNLYYMFVYSLYTFLR